MVTTLDSRLSSLALSTSWVPLLCSWARHFYFHSASLHPGEKLEKCTIKLYSLVPFSQVEDRVSNELPPLVPVLGHSCSYGP